MSELIVSDLRVTRYHHLSSFNKTCVILHGMGCLMGAILRSHNQLNIANCLLSLTSPITVSEFHNQTTKNAKIHSLCCDTTQNITFIFILKSQMVRQ